MRTKFFLFTWLAITLIHASRAADPTPIQVAVPVRDTPVSYSKEIVDILSAKCLACHNDTLAENRLNMEEVAGMLKGGKTGPALVAGQADRSLLFAMAAHRVKPVMPPKEKKDLEPLTSQELGLLKLWIDAGAKDDSDTAEAEAKVEIGTLPPGLHAVEAVDITPDGLRIASGRANLVQVHDADSGLEIISLAGHKDFVQSIKFSPNGRLLAAGGYQTVGLWNAPTGGLLAKSEGHGDAVKAVAPLNGGDRYVSASLDKTIRVWETATGKLLKTFPTPAAPTALAASGDSKSLAVGYPDGSIQVIAAEDGKEVAKLTGHTGPINRLAFLAQNAKLASTSDDSTARIWPIPAAPADKKADPLTLARHKGAVRGLAVLADGQTVATSGDDATIRLWNSETGKLLQTYTLQGGAIRALAVDSKGTRFLTASADGVARILDRESATITATLKGHLGGLEAVAFNPAGDRVATAGGFGGVKVWEAENGRGVLAFGHTSVVPGAVTPSVACLAFLKDDLVVSGSLDKTLKSWRFEGRWTENRWLGPHVFRVLTLDFNPDGTLLATGGGEPSRSGEIKLWEIGKGMLVRTLDSLHSDTVFGVKFSPDGSLLASGAGDKFLKVTRIDSGKEYRSYEGHTSHVLSVDWKSDGKQLVSGGADNVLKVWEVESGEQLRTMVGAAKQVTSVRWIPDKAEVAGASGDQTVRIWNPDNAGVVRAFSGSSDYLFSVASSKDGKRIVSGGADGILYLWDGVNTQLLQKLEVPQERRP